MNWVLSGILLAGTPKSRELVRKPSSIYWTGLRLFQIIRTELSLSEYVAKEDRQRSFTDLLSATGDEKGLMTTTQVMTTPSVSVFRTAITIGTVNCPLI